MQAAVAGGGVRSGRIHANGLDFPILEAGSGPLVLCLHGFPDHPESWVHLLQRLSQEGYRAVAPALRGYWTGGAAPDGSYRAGPTGQDVLALIEALGDSSAFVIGHDLGARAAYAAASLDPKRIKKLVGIAVPYGRGLPNAFVADGDQQRRSWYMFFFQTRFAEIAIQRSNFEFLDRLWMEWSPSYKMTDKQRHALHETFKQRGVLSQALDYYRQLFSPPTEIDALAIETLASRPITVPVLYLHGSDDGCISEKCSEEMEEMCALGFERIVLDGVGHFLHLERPDEVLSYIVPFLKS